MDGRDEVTSGSTSPRRTRRHGALASLWLVVLLASLGTSIANVALPALGAELGAGFAAAQWVVLAYLLAATSVIVAVGRLGDLAGRRRLLLGGLLLFAAASLQCAAASSLALLIAGRAAQGVGAATMMALSLAMARESAPDDGVGRAMGLLATSSALGTALGPTLGGMLLETGGWRAVFLLLAPGGAAAFLLVLRSLPADPVPIRPLTGAFDWAGALLLSATLLAYALAMTAGGGGFGAGNLGLLAGAAAGLALFARVESRAESPLVRLTLFRDGALSAALGANLVVSAVVMATLVIGPFYLGRSLGLAPSAVGLAMSLGPSLVALAGIPAGRVADRLGGRPTSLAGLAIIAAGCAALAALPTASGLAGYLVPVAAITLGYALFQTANNLVAMTRTTRQDGGAVSGLLNLSRNLGLITGAALMGAVFAAASGSEDSSIAAAEDIAAGMRASFALAAALAASAFAFSVAGGRWTALPNHAMQRS